MELNYAVSSLLHGFFSNCVEQGQLSSWYMGFTVWWFLLLWSTDSRACELSSCSSQTLDHRLNSCGKWASLPHGMWDLLRSETEPVSSALPGRFFTSDTLGKSPMSLLNLVAQRQSQQGRRVICNGQTSKTDQPLHCMPFLSSWFSVHRDDLLLLFIHQVVSDSLRPHRLQHAKASLSPTISWSLPKFISIA